MASSVPKVFWKFESLKGCRNYHQWARAVKSLSIRQRTWDVVSGVDRGSIDTAVNLPAESAGEASSFMEKESKQTSTDKTAEQVIYGLKNQLARKMFQSKIDISIWHYFAHLGTAADIWKLAKDKFGQADIKTVDSEFAALCSSNASKFESIEEYYNHIANHNLRLKEWGKVVPDWCLASIFRSGLTADHDLHMFYMMEDARISQRELTIDEMAQALNRSERYRDLLYR